MKVVTVRPAQLSDAQRMLDIYAPNILHSFVTFENEVPEATVFAQRIAHYEQRFPWLVYDVDGTIAGYVYASPHRDRAAYQWCCESSIYMHESFKGRGAGKVLYQTLFHLLKLQGLRRVYAGITLPNEASVRLHDGLGFQWLATYDHVGYKMGEWKDVGWWQLQLNPLDALPQPPTPFTELPQKIWKDACSEAGHKIGQLLARKA